MYYNIKSTMSTNTIPLNNSISKPGFLDSVSSFFSEHSFLAIVFGFIMMVMFAVFISAKYDNVGSSRQNVVFSNINMIFMAFLFVYIIVKFAGEKINLFGKSFDMGLFLYIAIVFFIAFVLGG